MKNGIGPTQFHFRFLKPNGAKRKKKQEEWEGRKSSGNFCPVKNKNERTEESKKRNGKKKKKENGKNKMKKREEEEKRE